MSPIDGMVDAAVFKAEVEKDPLLKRAFNDNLFLMAFYGLMNYEANRGADITVQRVLDDARGFAEGFYDDKETP